MTSKTRTKRAWRQSFSRLCLIGEQFIDIDLHLQHLLKRNEQSLCHVVSSMHIEACILNFDMSRENLLCKIRKNGKSGNIDGTDYACARSITPPSEPLTPPAEPIAPPPEPVTPPAEPLAQPMQADGAAESIPVQLEPSLDEKLANAEERAEELQDAFLRAKAEVENFRRRAQEDITRAHKFAIENFAEALLPVKDSLETALKVETPSSESLKQGVEMTLKQLDTAFKKTG